MSILSAAFDGFIDFIAGAGSSPSNNLGQNNPNPNFVGPPQPGQVASQTGDGMSTGQALFTGLSVLGPLITTAVSRPKAPKMPEAPKFPDVPDSVKNDPRVQQLLGAYGFPDNMPAIQPYKVERPTAFQQAFPAMFNTALSIFGAGVADQTMKTEAEKAALTAQQQRIDNLKNSSTVPNTTPQQVADTTVTLAQDRFFPKGDPRQPTEADAKLRGIVDTKAYERIKQYDGQIEELSKANGIDANLVRAVIAAESSGDTKASREVTPRDTSYGLGQFTLPTAADVAGRKVSKEELKDPNVSLPLIASHLAALSKKFDGDYDKIISAYNAGARATETGRAARFPQVKRHTAKVRKHYIELSKLYG
jgi:hypothetical protein